MIEADGGRHWSIGALARACGVTVRALHHYDRIGLAKQTASGHRRGTARRPEDAVKGPGRPDHKAGHDTKPNRRFPAADSRRSDARHTTVHDNVGDDVRVRDVRHPATA
ncbi:MAG TPA: MerR family DNA-binding transcriptional regulator [Pseudonocardiaceae bacterium]|nr:MerR family DNA-binding transcriptional regulator [Pseudonocardiaceae bacterium]